jgi:uncharacterized protein
LVEPLKPLQLLLLQSLKFAQQLQQQPQFAQFQRPRRVGQMVNPMMARCWCAAAIFLASLLIGSGVGLADPHLPARTGAVVDAANIIGANQEQSLAAKAAKLQSELGVELVVVTLPSLQGYTIERWGRDLGNRWQVGGSTARGVVLIVAPNDREVRIEVGDGLPLSDSTATSIINNVIVPQFRSGEMSGGILAGVDAIARAATGSKPHANSAPPIGDSGVNWLAAGPLLLLALLGLFVVLKAMRGTLSEGPAQEPSQGEFWPDPSPVLTKANSPDHRRSGWFASDSIWSSSRSSGWLSSGGRSSRGFGGFSSGRSSGGFSGRGASGRW